MKVIKGAIVLALFLGQTSAIVSKSRSHDDVFIDREQVQIMFKKQPDFMDFEMKDLPGQKQQDPKAQNDDDKQELSLVKKQEQAKQ